MVRALRNGGFITIGLGGALFALAVQAAGGDFVVPGSKAAGLKSCVEATDVMRRNHMELIQHQRDATVRNGIRSTKHSLADCIACHVSRGADKKPVPVDAPDQFCGKCHAYAAVSLDCFQCHTKTPGSLSGSNPGHGLGGGDVVSGGPRAVMREVGQ